VLHHAIIWIASSYSAPRCKEYKASRTRIGYRKLVTKCNKTLSAL